MSFIAHHALPIAAGLIVAAFVLMVVLEVRSHRKFRRLINERRSHWRSPR